VQPTRRVNKGRLSDQVYEALQADIVSGDLAPGQRLVETEIAKSFEVSQAPVRDALKRLAHEGLVLQEPRRGTFVASIDEQTARRSYELRALLEPYAATEFCAYAPDDALDVLRAHLDDMRAAAQDDDVRRFVEADTAFHRTVWEATGHPVLPRTWSPIESAMRALTPVSNQLYFGNLAEIAETHGPLIDALADRDAARSGRLFGEHVTEVWRRINASRARE
jgi:DNA-binding GntR family transcriptional regulator